MTYQRFEDLPVWNAAIELAEGCEDFLSSAKDRISWSKRDQLERASLSVSNNIAEGFERGTTNELLAFLYIARGSAGEVRSMLAFFECRPSLIPTFLASVPVVFLVYYAAALGEAAGYLFGLRVAEEKFVKWELNTARIA